MKVAVFGLGYVGTVTAAGLAARGHDVVGVDVDESKVAAVQAGHSPVVEPGLEQLVADGVRSRTLRATTDPSVALDGADVSLMCVGTPSTSYGGTDLTALQRALVALRKTLDEVPPPASGLHCVVVRSTVPPGTGDTVVVPAFAGEPLPPGWTVGTAMCPEFLREGSGIEDFLTPPFLVVGTADDRVAATIESLFEFLTAPVHRVDVRTAEALKYACNAFHATKISFANEVARVFRGYGVDTRRVMEIFCQDRLLNISPAYLRPGFAYGGSCLPKDLRALQHMARTSGVDVPLLAGTSLTNELVVRDLVDRIIATGMREVCILGLSFKGDTDDLRESPNVELAERLIGKGFDVSIYDPIVNPDRLVGANRTYVESKLPHVSRLLARTADEALERASVVVVSSTDPEVLDALARSTTPSHVFDVNGHLGDGIEHLAAYEGLGW